MHDPHGYSTVEYDKQIIRAQFVGSFNLEGVQEYISKVKKIVKQHHQEKLMLLVDIQKFDGATPEAYTEMDAYNAWCNAQQCIVAKALVTKQRPVQAITRNYAPSYKEKQVQFFETIDETKLWLESFIHP